MANMTKVKNLNGTSDNKAPSGYTSWRNWWETKKNRKFSTCSCVDCIKNAEVGAHVQKVGPSDKWYIVPLCNSCNVGKKNLVFEVRDNDLEPVNS
jgi:hypothetical protein